MLFLESPGRRQKLLGVVVVRVDLQQAVDIVNGFVIMFEQHAGGDQIAQGFFVLAIQLKCFLKSRICKIKGVHIPEQHAHFVVRDRLVRIDPEGGAIIFQGLLKLT